MIKLLYKIFYFKIPRIILNHFILKEKMSSLKTIAKSGHYKNRLYIAERIKSFSNENKLGLIAVLYNDKIEIVSRLAIEESNKLSLPESIQFQINQKVEYWIDKRIETERNEEKIERLLENSTNTKRKFSNGETYQGMKNMLKKPLNTGKWM